ncbi:MAG: HD domain-containing phosphohydrolase [Planctomycetota bacterium]|jgi:HD-GYP domain-containing protein (c-di-GMP phosphodiesterase class II)
MLDTISKSIDSSQLRELKRFGDRVNRFGANFAVYGGNGELILLCEAGKFESSRERLAEHGRIVLEEQNDTQSSCEARDGVCRVDEANRILSAILKFADGTSPLVALIDLGDSAATNNDRLREFCREQNIDYERLADVLAGSVQSNSECLSQTLAFFAGGFHAKQEAEEQIEMVGSELAQTYEELVLLHKLSTNMKVTESDANYLQMACDSLTDIIGVEGIAVLLERAVDDEKQLVLSAGSGLIDIDEHLAAVLQSRLAEEINSGKEALLDSEVGSPFKYDWPASIQSIIAVALQSSDRIGPHAQERTRTDSSMVGLMVAINRIDKQDFDSTDVKLFNSVANGCAVFIENRRLFKELKGLFIGSLKALTSSIDAKDQYTRGHSERVAFISRWIAEKLAEEEPLEEEQIHKVYLAGLLHDIGKVGIDEAVLCKKGKLTELELNHIRAHPAIGASILSEIKQMRDVVPGVLCHHERVDGKGYPNGLVGEEIPRIGYIVGLADSFDAMTSKRVYRDALTVEQAMAEIKEGLGTQFDEQVGKIFIENNVYELWDIMQDGFAEIYGKGDFLEYGTVAVGTLIR